MVLCGNVEFCEDGMPIAGFVWRMEHPDATSRMAVRENTFNNLFTFSPFSIHYIAIDHLDWEYYLLL
jgi:hypothetical protein